MGIKRRYRIQWTMALGVALGGIAGQALAADPVQSPTDNNGLMSFPNVRVVNAPLADASSATNTEAGMRAYVDPQTGELTSAPTPEQAATLSKTAPARSASPARTAAADTGAVVGTEIYGPGNAIGYVLGEESMVFQMAQLDDNGTVTQQCVTGKTAAEVLLSKSESVQADSHEENHNDR